MRTRLLAVCLSAILILAMLSDVSAAPRKRPADSPTSAEANSIQRLGQGLAKALAFPIFRARIAEELSKSPYVEGRIPLKRLMAGDNEVRQELLRQSALDLSWEKVAGLLPELELYFPFANHRQAWAGEAEIQVAVPAEISDTYWIYATDGSTWSVRGPNPPAVPTLLLGPSEIDYDDKESALVGGVRTGAYLRQRAAELGLFLEWSNEGKRSSSPLSSVTAESSSGLDASRHTYLTYFYIPEWEEPWPDGDMEIEVFGSVDGVYSGCQRFTNIRKEIDYYLPPAGASGSWKIAYAVPAGANTVDVRVYEDDDTGCVVKIGGTNGDDDLGVANLQITHFNDIYGTSPGNQGSASVRVGTQNTICGDGSCGGDESRSNCCTDCVRCGNGVCDTSCGESSSTCWSDCPRCGDGLCQSGENSSNCCTDCARCGNGLCEKSCGESTWTCSTDCTCGNGLCESGESSCDCPDDCGFDPCCDDPCCGDPCCGDPVCCGQPPGECQ
jgi:hypothetical protein